MLVVERRPGTALWIGDNIRVQVRWIRHRKAVRLGIEAPREMAIVREELVQQGGRPVTPRRMNAVEAPPVAFHVLLIEDNQDHADLIRFSLEDAGIDQVSHFARAAPALEALTAEADAIHPDLVILDLSLPDQSGLDVIRSIRQAPGLKPLPVVVFTCSNDQASVSDCLEAGANAFVAKSDLQEDVSTAVKRIADFWSHSQRVNQAGR